MNIMMSIMKMTAKVANLTKTPSFLMSVSTNSNPITIIQVYV